MKSLGGYNRFNPNDFKKLKKMTKGEQRVRLDFNPSLDNKVTQTKKQVAKMIDDLEGYKNDLLSTNQYTVDSSVFAEQLRLIAIAQTALEEAAMWTVKAYTEQIQTKV